jgi:hypothetical protein
MSGASGGGRRFVVTAQRRVHILDGDHTGGGHRAGSGGGKSEFPAAWSDDAIIDAIEEVANDPASVRAPGRNGKIRFDSCERRSVNHRDRGSGKRFRRDGFSGVTRGMEI